MKIRCITNQGINLPPKYLDAKAGFTNDIEFPVIIEKEYIVYALSIRGDQIWYYINDENDLYYPVHHPAPLFEVVTDSISKYWKLKVDVKANNHENLLLLAFDDWVSDDFFYDKLTDKIESIVDIYLRFKKLIDLENVTDSLD